MMRWRKWYASGRHSGTCSANSGHLNRILMYYLFRFASVVIPLLPRWFVVTLANVISPGSWRGASKARKQANAHMIHVLGPQELATRAGRKRLRRTAGGISRKSVRNHLEVFL